MNRFKYYFYRIFYVFFILKNKNITLDLISKIFKIFISVFLRFLLWIIFLPISVLLHLFKVRFVYIISQHIGHLTIQPYIIHNITKYDAKFKKLKFILLSNSISNSSVLRKWSEKLLILKNPTLCFLLKGLSFFYFCKFDVRRFDASHFNAQEIYKFNKKVKSKKFLSLNNKELSDLEILKDNIGIKKFKFHVCIQARDSSYFKFDYLQNHRNNDINRYQKAVDYINKLGGVAIVVGRYNNKCLLKNVINYNISNHCNDYHDMLLIASNLFFLGQTSGLCFLSSVFNKPVMHSNMIPISTMGLFENDLSINKMLRNDKGIIHFKNLINKPLGNYFYSYQYRYHPVTIEQNSEDDIYIAVKDMFYLLKNKRFNDTQMKLIKNYKSSFCKTDYGYLSPAFPSPSFLKKYKKYYF